MKRFILTATVLLMVLVTGTALAQDSIPKGWSKLAQGWIPAIQAEGTYDPSSPGNVSQKLVDTLLALQKEGITPDYLKKIDATGAAMTNVVFWGVQGQDATKIKAKVLATPGAQAHPLKSPKKPRRKA